MSSDSSSRCVLIGRMPLSVMVFLLMAVPIQAEDTRPATLRAGSLLAPKAFRAAAAKVRPALVAIETFGGIAPAKTGKRRGGAAALSNPGDGPTTGLIVSPDGYVLTSTFNLITRPPVITVIREDGSRHVAKLVARDDDRRLCLLKVDDVNHWPVATTVADDDLKVGQWTVTVGLGNGNQPSISAGILSAKHRIGGRAVQTDANISPVNYGGALLDIDGRVIGICVPLNPGSTNAAAGVEWYNSGIGFAIPLADLGPRIDIMKTGKSPQSAALGVRVQEASSFAAAGTGIEIIEVQKDSAVAKAGIVKGDRLLTVADRAISNATQLRFSLIRLLARQSVDVVVLRGKERKRIRVVLDAAKPAVVPATKPAPKKPATRKPER